MFGWVRASLVFFGYVIVVAPLVPGLPRRRRLLATAGSVVGLLLTVFGGLQPPTPALHDWLLPPVLLLLAYWASGLLFARPMPRAERALEAIDGVLDVDALAARTPRWFAELLELAYAGVYPLIPTALIIHVIATTAPSPERFWTVILITDFACFAFLPWVQTRPPRAFRRSAPWASQFRIFNERMLGKTSIQVNTFPSGHAAEALAAALLVIGAPWPLVAYVAISAALISVGAVLGRYHYAADAVSGWMVAVAVWIVV